MVVAQAILNWKDFEKLSEFKWKLSAQGYAYRSVHRPGPLLLHREILGLGQGELLCTDHRNLNKLDNRRRNLRRLRQCYNSQNLGLARNNTTGHRMVSWYPRDRKYRVKTKRGGQSVWIGQFCLKRDAIAAAKAWRRLNMPFGIEANCRRRSR